ncbi:MAG TPA: sodium:proton antiporter [Chiayiivirga sp.]|nr:sodium:proton antiporter [Chiayiivirga sp.]
MLWSIPFVGLLLSIALWPLLAPAFWHRHFGKITAAWALAYLVPNALMFGLPDTSTAVVHAFLAEYLPFVILLSALFVVSGGIHIRGNLHGTPALNTGLLTLGAALASVMGTTGASMLLIRPLLRANDERRYNAHVVVFFIFIVCNIAGSLTPLGDPPLFLGFLKGVDFFWTSRHLWPETLTLLVILLTAFHLLDRWMYRHDQGHRPDPTPDTAGFTIDGARNFVLLAMIVGLVLLSGLWKPEITFELHGTLIGLPSLIRDLGMIVVILVSLAITPASAHAGNQFSWGPMQEVAKLFAGIFITLIPMISMLQAGVNGPFSAVLGVVTDANGHANPMAYFWATGLLSSVLDNAPTYLVFFNTAGGDANVLMGSLAPVLAAISAGAVFMGALTYIGNAPNLMVAAIAIERGVRMPSFFGYMLWSCGILLPLFALSSWVFVG